MNEFKMILPEEAVVGVEALGVEVDGRRGVIENMIQMNMDLSTDAFNEYQHQLSEFTAKFDAAKKVIEDTYIKPEYPNAIDWNLDYKTGELTIHA